MRCDKPPIGIRVRGNGDAAGGPACCAKTLFAVTLPALLLLLSLAGKGWAWSPLEQGLLLQTFPGEFQSSGITLLKIDPHKYDLLLLSASEMGTGTLTLREWAKRYGLIAAINASMYQQDRLTSTGYMRNFAHLNNPSINPRFGAFLLFNPKQEGEPRVRLVDRHHVPEWRDLLSRYESVVQNYRMISAERSNAWSASSQAFSMAGVGLDMSGNLLFIHSRLPRPVHELNRLLLSLPLEIGPTMYVEGGPTAGLYINEELLGFRLFPGYGGALWHDLDTVHRVPNVLGVVQRQ
jgi:hypothetical protein